MDTKLYSDFYKTVFGQEILQRELEFIDKELNGCERVLSIGYGLAIHEVQLAKLHPDIEMVGLDISKDMLAQAPGLPKNVDLILGNAEQLSIKDKSIDFIYFIFSFEFIPDIENTLREAKRVLIPNGKTIFMVANKNSWYVKKELDESNSYLKRKFENLDLENLCKIISKYLDITSTKLMLGIRDNKVFESEDPKWASLYMIKAIKGGCQLATFSD